MDYQWLIYFLDLQSILCCRTVEVFQHYGMQAHEKHRNPEYLCKCQILVLHYLVYLKQED